MWDIVGDQHIINTSDKHIISDKHITNASPSGAASPAYDSSPPASTKVSTSDPKNDAMLVAVHF